MSLTYRRPCFGQRQLRTTFTEGKGELVNSLKTGNFYSIICPKNAGIFKHLSYHVGDKLFKNIMIRFLLE
jgi:hypothetical protein